MYKRQEDEGDTWALEELTRLRAAVGDDPGVVVLLLKRAELALEGVQALALKHEAATVLVDKLRDAARAITLYEEILDAEPSDAQAAAALRTLYADAGRDKDLARLLSRLVDVATTQEERATLRIELARLQADRFRAPDDAIETLRGILDEDPSHPQAVLTLSQLFEQTGRDAELADPVSYTHLALKFQLLVDAAARYEKDLGDRREAVECLVQALSLIHI